MGDFINHLSRMESSFETKGAEVNRSREAEIPFQDIFAGVLDDLQQSEEVVRASAVEVASGNADRLHDLTIASTKAEMALKLFVQLRNKGHDAYSEIMRMSV